MSKVNISHRLLGALIKSVNKTAVDMKPQELSNCLLAALQLKLSAESKITVSFAEAGGADTKACFFLVLWNRCY